MTELSRATTDKEFLIKMQDVMGIENFKDMSLMCEYLCRYAMISYEISVQNDHSYLEHTETNLLEVSRALSRCAVLLDKAYLDNI